jgi:hypothetical protein
MKTLPLAIIIADSKALLFRFTLFSNKQLSNVSKDRNEPQQKW